MRRTFASIASALVLGLSAAAGASEVHVVEMLNRSADGENMVFSPAITFVEPGDTVRFVSTDPGHNAETIDGAIPEGAEGWKTRINQDAEVTITEEGIYAYKCTPHFGVGMVGLIVAGDSTENIEAVRAARYVGRADQRMTALIDEIAQDS
jgi:pseudoazurin